MHTGKTWADLRQMSDDDLIAGHDHCAKNTGEHLITYRDELRHREQSRLTGKIVYLTWAMAAMTAVVLLATVANVILWALR